MISAGKGPEAPKQPDAKSTIPTGQIQPIGARPTMMPNFQKPSMGQPRPGMAETLAMSGVPQRQFDPQMAQKMLNQRIV